MKPNLQCRFGRRRSWAAAAIPACILFSFLSARGADAQPNADAGLDSTLARMPKPWLTKANRFDLREYQATLRYWREKHPDIFSYERRGATPEGLPLYLLKITDPAIPDREKQHPLIVALHSGRSRRGPREPIPSLASRAGCWATAPWRGKPGASNWFS